MAENSRVSFEKAKQKEKGVLGFLREIMRQYENGELTWEQLKLVTEHKNPFDPALAGEKLVKTWRQSELKLEDEFFHIDSFNWDILPLDLDGVTFAASAGRDIREIYALPLNRVDSISSLEVSVEKYAKSFLGIQLFSREAALRETRRANKSLPTISDWLRLLSDYFGRRIKIPKSALKSLRESSSEYSWEIVRGLRPDEMRKLERHFNLLFTSYYYKNCGMLVGDNGFYHCHEDKVRIYFSISQGRICIGKDPVDRMMAIRCLQA